MRTVTLIALALLLPACNARWKVDAAADVLHEHQAWTQALREHNSVALERILAPEFRIAFPEGGIAPVSRDQYLADAERAEFDALESGNVNLKYAGRDIVISRMGMTYENLAFDGAPRPGDHTVTDTWVRRDGRWIPIQRITEMSGAEGRA